MTKFSIIKTTCATKKEAKKIAKLLLNDKLVACAQISTIESLYLWNDKMVNQKEFLLSLKAKSDFYKQVERLIIDHHSYETPQIVEIRVSSIFDGYSKWLNSCLKTH